ncbi:glycosyltransferase family 2 protein [Pajaroellobacter abortibovis]|uniref:Glycosyltransferase 2-like domain-containing protein n=1 Tax=Pajaroellobacter abortibovis TaxID=1882918 RepID=A0A1L6MVM1_9BACT|nr:glycosyltransferase family A protein [Pajaroellobacter abortibovis]APR99593.1 hypothetical protein BCY86_02035 [Pajaroellobacter abortibovis]
MVAESCDMSISFYKECNGEEEQPLVTICVPTIGRLAYLPETIKSIQEQTYQNYEVLILDNASLMDAVKLFENYVDVDKRVRIVRSEIRLPMFANFNKGLKEARGKYISYFHDDDIYLPLYLESLVRFLENNSSVGLVNSNFEWIKKDGEIIRSCRPKTCILSGRRFIGETILTGTDVFSTPGYLYRRAALMEVEGFDESIPPEGGDRIILMRIAENWNVGFVSDLLWKYRGHSMQTSQLITKVSAIVSYDKLCDQYLKGLKKRWPAERKFVQKLCWIWMVNRLIRILYAWSISETLDEMEICLKQLQNVGVPNLILNRLRGEAWLYIRDSFLLSYAFLILKKIVRSYWVDTLLKKNLLKEKHR